MKQQKYVSVKIVEERIIIETMVDCSISYIFITMTS